MWPRVVEVMLGAWLAVSPFIFNHPAEEWWLWANDFSSSFAVIVLALLSHWRPLRYAHLLIAGVGLWLMGFGYFASPHPLPPALQNDLLMGMLLVMFATLPNEADLPPSSWRDFYARKPLS